MRVDDHREYVAETGIEIIWAGVVTSAHRPVLNMKDVVNAIDAARHALAQLRGASAVLPCTSDAWVTAWTLRGALSKDLSWFRTHALEHLHQLSEDAQ